MRGRHPKVRRALPDSVEQRWPASRSGSAFRQRRCHPAAPEYRRLRAEPGPPAPRRHVSGSAPAARIRVRAEPARPPPRQHVSCSAPAAVTRPRCPRFAAASARLPPPRGSCRATASRTRRATRSPHDMRGSKVRQQTLQQAQSLFALLVDGHLQGVAVGRHGAQRVARWHHLGSGGGQQAGDLAGAHAGGLLDQLALALRVQQRSRRQRAGRQLRKRIIPGRFRRERSGTQRLRWSRDRLGRHGARAPTPGDQRRRGRSCGAGPSSGRRRGGTATATGLQKGAAARRRRSTCRPRRSCAPACPAPPRARVPLPHHRSTARPAGPAQQRASPPAPRPACSPLVPHRRRTRRPAVQAPAPIGARAPLAHPASPGAAGSSVPSPASSS